MTRREDFSHLLNESWSRVNSNLCVGIDPRVEQLPPEFRDNPQQILDFCKHLVEATSNYACSFKPNIAFFASLGLENQLASLIMFIHEQYPDIPVILDAKRGDIGSTAEAYAKEVFERYEADAVTVNPFIGWDCVEPFLEYSKRGVFVLCRTSNRGSNWLQAVDSETPLYKVIAERVAENHNKNLGLVCGATHLAELKSIREIAPNTTFLIPGVGAQGADTKQTLVASRDHAGSGIVVNVSRGLLEQTCSHEFFENVEANAQRFAKELAIHQN